jgi:protein phosphatase
MLLDDEIQSILAAAADAEDAVHALVAAANDAGGLDNVTAVVVEFGEGAEPRATGGRRRAIAAGLWLIVAMALVAATAWGVREYASNRAYLVAEDGFVVVYRGVQGSFAGVEVSELMQRTDVRLADLPSVTAGRLSEGVSAGSVEDAFGLVEEYRSLASENATPAESTTEP